MRSAVSWQSHAREACGHLIEAKGAVESSYLIKHASSGPPEHGRKMLWLVTAGSEFGAVVWARDNMPH